jgi:hypothetical protein
MSAPGALLFGYFLLGTQEKVPRHLWRNIREKYLALQGEIKSQNILVKEE